MVTASSPRMPGVRQLSLAPSSNDSSPDFPRSVYLLTLKGHHRVERLDGVGPGRSGTDGGGAHGFQVLLYRPGSRPPGGAHVVQDRRGPERLFGSEEGLDPAAVMSGLGLTAC